MTPAPTPAGGLVPGLPDLAWVGPEGDATFEDGRLSITAGERTDWFNDPNGESRVATAPVLAFEQRCDFQLSARVSVDFANRFDAGVLFIHRSDEDYAKLCFERSPAGDDLVVSVVTKMLSDDANGPAIEADHVWLRLSGIGPVHAFHYSTDGRSWHMVRLFRLHGDGAPTRIGLSSQAPTGPSCRSRFDDLRYVERTLLDPRDGS